MYRLLVRIALPLATLCPALVMAQQTPATATPAAINIPAGSLVDALDALARQTGMQFVYNADQLAGLQTRGVHGQTTASAALDTLLQDTGYRAHRDDSGAVVIVKDHSAAQPAPAPAAGQTGSDTGAADESKAKTLKKMLVTGSRIPRAEIEGPAPVVTISAADIQARGLVTVPDIMTSLTQNVGELRNNQYTNSFAPGAQAVDLRGLGPSYTLVLVNGRRFADYPQAYRGNSNFSDISNIPTALIDRVEILSGSASAVYGSDAISGVINFILKEKVDGTTVDYRIGKTQHGGQDSQRLHITSGFSAGKLDTVFGLELFKETPLYAYQRSYTDSRLDSPAENVLAARTFLRLDSGGYYLDPGKETCDALSYLDEGTIFYAQRPGYGYGGPGYYCGTYDALGYGTLHNGRKMANLYASGTYHFNSNTDFYLNVLAGTSHQDSLVSTLQWSNCETENGECTDTPFYNAATGQVEQWQRRYFTLEENGGLDNALARNINNTLSLNTGVRGTLGDDSFWDYEINFEHSHNDLKSKYPELIAARAQALYLGPSLGIDPDSGLKVYDAPPERLYTPLTVSEFRSITQDSIDRDHSRTENWSLKVTNTDLFQLPAGSVGFAGIAEYGNSYLEQNVDPLSLDGSYYGLHGTSATGSRNRSALGYEFRVPVFSNFNVTTAGRYDRYEYGESSPGKFTYTLGLEYRPFQSVLLRGSLSTGFRAPDLSYLFSGLSGSSSGGTDYYLCRRDEPEAGPDFYDNCSNGYVYYNGRSNGSTDLNYETSKSFTYGIVFSPTPNFDISADYYRVKLKDKVEYQSSQTILRREADCRLGQDINGNPVDGDSAYCQRIESQVTRNPADYEFDPEGITAVLVHPINLAMDETSGVDVRAHYRLDAHRAGRFLFNAGATYVSMHKVQESPEVPVDNKLTDIYYYGIPRLKANASATWNFHDFTATLYGSRLSGLPNYAATKRLAPTFLYNASMGYQITPDINVSLVIDNLRDTRPQYDPTWTSYPYYYRSWFSPKGRAYYAQFTMHFGGSDR